MVHCFGALCDWEYHAFLLVLCQCFLWWGSGGCDIGCGGRGRKEARIWGGTVVAVAAFENNSNSPEPLFLAPSVFFCLIVIKPVCL